MKNRVRNSVISIFVVCWCLLYHYMSLKHFYLEPLVKKPLPRVPMLFPPAGWIMFYNVQDQFAEVNIYGLKGVRLLKEENKIRLEAKNKFLIDPHDIFRTRTILFDNIKRGLIYGAIERQKQFCAFLEKKFPAYDAFEVSYIFTPHMSKKPHEKYEQIQYQCLSEGFIKNEHR